MMKKSICFVFVDMESLSTPVQFGYINYRVRAFVPRPKQFDREREKAPHGREKQRCPSCRKDHVFCFFLSEENVTCSNCGGNHEATSSECSIKKGERERGLSRAFHTQRLLKRVEGLNGGAKAGPALPLGKIRAPSLEFKSTKKNHKMEFQHFITKILNL